ncbi:hypothetical protein EDEG_02988 [Edhazardia aedis USNM 41457]|uniref:Uncharacterized protein n=1 Tax=Edhazardia aedis (strain USNM 41457) TaxID=1003232 RepID=J9D511_EDHAE|nr:hypothetical protein EDEG_02988 [Edhazardia aedis USNM 41457]|eukprot:EJW02614.1 hypothetical protein EDEG_02988 [Edhazardia aedis USNM 41457]
MILINILLHILQIINSTNDIEQINTLDNFTLDDDESSFATIPSNLPRKHNFTESERHARNAANKYTHKIITKHYHSPYNGIIVPKHLDYPLDAIYMPHKKDSYGHHIFRTKPRVCKLRKNRFTMQYSITMHTPQFPFSDKISPKAFDKNRKFGANLMEAASFH